VAEAGTGNPLLYLHGPWASEWSPFLDRLAARNRVIAPRQPGFGASSGDEHMLDLHDLLYYYLDLLDTLELDRVPLVGHSLGAMIAAELAAVQPRRFSALVLVAPLGLWNEAHPVPDFLAMTRPQLAAALFTDPQSAQASELLAGPPDGQAAYDFQVDRAKAMTTTAKYTWPLPNRGLNKRIHRITMPTLLVWGERDGTVPIAYADDFRALIPQARLEVIPAAAHLVDQEQPDRLAEVISGFLAATDGGVR
jgi:pimeloyl-ACP methyl ester carboxylesterase